MVELHIDTMAIDADVPTEEMLKDGATPNVVCQILGGSELPFANPQNPNVPMRFPSISVNFQMDKATALKYAEMLKEKAESLPDPNTAKSKLAIVSDIGEADKVVDINKRLTKK